MKLSTLKVLCTRRKDTYNGNNGEIKPYFPYARKSKFPTIYDWLHFNLGIFCPL